MKILLLLLLNFLFISCNSGGEDASKGFGIKIPESTHTNNNGGNDSANLMSIVSGDSQSVAVGGTAGLPLTVLVLQAPGEPVANQAVYFSVVGGASRGFVSSASAVTDASGYAEVYFTAGVTIGQINIVATAPQGSVSFSMTVTGATGYSLNYTSSLEGNNQTGNVNTTLLLPFRAVLTNSDGDPVAGYTIRFVATGSVLGNFSGSSFVEAVTDVNGMAQSGFFSLNTQSGAHAVTAYMLGDSSVNLAFTATAEVPPLTVISPGLSTLTLSHGQLAADAFNSTEATLVIRDQYGNPIPNNTYAPSIVITATPGLLGSTWEGAGWVYTDVGTYKRSLTVGNFSGTILFGSEINSVQLTSTSPSLVLTVNSSIVNANTTLTATIEPLAADGFTTTTIIAQLRDQFNNPIDLSGQDLVLSTSAGTLIGGSMQYHALSGTYRQSLRSPTSVGGGSLTVTLQSINTVPVGGVSKNVALTGGALSLSESTLSIAKRYFNGAQTHQVLVQLNDANGNPVTTSATVELFQNPVNSGASVGAFSNSGFATHVTNGLYQINLTGPGACSNGPCTTDLTAKVTIGSDEAILGPLRVQYGQAALTPTAAGSYVVMNNVIGRSGLGASTLTGTIFLRQVVTPLLVGGHGSNLSVNYTGCSPANTTITDNNNGTYTFVIYSPAGSCTGSAAIQYGGVNLSGAPGGQTPNPVNISFYGELSLAHSSISVFPTELSGVGSVTVSLGLKDTNSSPIPSCADVDVSKIRFANDGHSQFSGAVTCSVIGGMATYQQIFERTATPDVDFETETIEAEYDGSSGWTSFIATTNFSITPPNLAGATIDCTSNPYHDKPIYVNGGTLTINSWIDGGIPTTAFCSPGNPMRFKKLVVGPTGVVTHSAATTSNAYGIDIQVTEEVEIKGGGEINVNGKGYLRGDVAGGNGYGPGNGATVEGAAGYGSAVQSTNVHCFGLQPGYGLSHDPNYPGSGGKSFAAPGVYVGGTGGGLVRIKTSSMKLAGRVLANSTVVLAAGQAAGGCGGSGGGIKIDLEVSPGVYGPLEGSGFINAHGTDGYTTNEGSGGRIAILAHMEQFDGQISAMRGEFVTALTSEFGNGSLYFAQSNSSFTLPHSMNVGGSGGSYFGKTSLDEFPDVLIPSGQNVNILFKIGSSATHESVSLTNYADQPKVEITATENIVMESSSSINVSGKGFPKGDGSSNPAYCGFGDGFVCTSLRSRVGTIMPAGVSQSGEGGVHLQKGGNYTGLSFWGNISSPNTYGGSGASFNQPRAGNGGGIIRLIAGDILDLNGVLSANGLNSSINTAGGGAGGSIYLKADSIMGTPQSISSNGGNSGISLAGHYYGGGAGGLIRVERASGNFGLAPTATKGDSYSSGVLETNPADMAEDGTISDVFVP